MKRFLSAFLIIFSLFLFSCASDSFVPGAGSRQIENIYKEYMILADSYYDIQKYEKAEVFYKKASDLKELYWPCSYKLAEVYLKLSKWDQAETYLKKLIERDSDNSVLQEKYAFALASKGDFDSALKIYSELCNIENPSQSSLENYLVLLVTKEQTEEAKVQLEILKEKFPSNTNISKYEEKLNPVTEEIVPVDENNPEVKKEESSQLDDFIPLEDSDKE